MTEPLRSPSFDRHRKIEFALVAAFERLREIARKSARTELAEGIAEALDRIEKHRFSIAVVGEFKRGKSTFINALLGREILPADIVPTSATINRATYGLKPSVKILFKEGQGPRAGGSGTGEDGAGGEGEEIREQTIAIDELSDYVTKLTDESTARAATIEESVVYYPNPFLKNNVDIIDTPGLSDEVAMTEVTLGVLPRVDAAILVVLATSPFAQTEAQFLESLLVDHGLARVLFVVTALDRIEAVEQRERLLASIRERIRGRIREHAARRFGEGSEACEEYLARVGDPKVFGISGYQALRGKAEHDEALFAASGFADFEAFLEEFLTQESGVIALRTHLERVQQFCVRLREGLEDPEAASIPPALAGPERERATAFLLDAVEALGQKGIRAAEELARRGHEIARQRFAELPGQLRSAAESALNGLTIRAEDLEPERLGASVGELTRELFRQSLIVSRERGRAFSQQVHGLWREAMLPLLELRTVCDRVLVHFDVPVPDAPVPDAAGTPGFDLEQDVDGALATFFGPSELRRSEVFAAAFRLSEQWPTLVRVDSFVGPQIRIMKKAVDLVRIEKFKADLKKAVLQAVEQDLARHHDERQRQIAGQLDEDLSRLSEVIRAMVRQIQERRTLIQRHQERRAVEAEGRRQARGQMLVDVERIREQAQELHRELGALG